MLAALLIFSGCSILANDREAAIFFIDQGAARYIESETDPVKRAERAQEVRRVIEPVLLAATDSAATVDQLEAVFYSQFDFNMLEPSDQKIIKLLVSDVKRSLTDATGGGILDDDTKIFIRDLVETVLLTAAAYGI